MFDWLGSAQLNRIEHKLNILLRREKYEMAQQEDIKAALAKVTADVAAQTTVVAGMSAYVAGIQAHLAALAGQTKDEETAGALMALAAQIESNTKSDADAMAANLGGTAPAPAPTPTPEPTLIDPAPTEGVPANPAP